MYHIFIGEGCFNIEIFIPKVSYLKANNAYFISNSSYMPQVRIVFFLRYIDFWW
jgi:hypothetical protein